MHTVDIYNARDAEPSNLFYGGRAGQKEGVLLDGEAWIAKYPRTTKELKGKRLPSYTSSPISEFVGAGIYRLAGIDTHETILGYRNGKIVCLCKDFAYPDKRLFEFKEIKNAMSDDSEGYSSVPSDGEAIILGDVLQTIETSPLLKSIPGVLGRFWEMFVVDAIIKNPDRNNGNWGVLRNADGSFELAPVYDLGSSLFSKRSDSLAAERLGSEASVEEDAFATNVSCYRLADENGDLHAIHPFDYMAETKNPDLQAAMARITDKLDMEEIANLIDSVPTEAYGHVLLGDATREAHKRLIAMRLEKLKELACTSQAS